ncbi:GNAT family N-acetyltransferase [Slackia heliotrinireducens]|uniref:N-acetylglutamate synthase n=1 Tax=Slackia heliotrinireducens (strain ATCC 29202 / DSM 20476 / NCTC 11029 / RHS 1) TaxID=471855 RepID=C7N6Z4_SLAHD|nr:GNAT family N-acetyltransferase [Slackia heliotrinireducens]ACV22679.1 N-acetylglutamate synthase [Slackia heliotrinireducens DSM 20476]VEH01266.1 Acetyltransferase YpeA [Slackia heliotrinireducens]
MAASKVHITLRVMTADDYDGVYDLWKRTSGFALRSTDDSREYVERFLRRNPTTSVVALDGERIVGTILCGHDGRQGSMYHVAVDSDYREHHIGRKMVDFCLEALKAEKISKVTLVAFESNEGGNRFWQRLGWIPRPDLNTYEIIIGDDYVIHVVD